MKYEIKQNDGGMAISVGEVRGDEEKLLAAFRACQEGRCSCPSMEFRKLDALEVTQDAAGIELRLKAKDGEAFDRAEIEKCLNHTAGQLKQAGDDR